MKKDQPIWPKVPTVAPFLWAGTNDQSYPSDAYVCRVKKYLPVRTDLYIYIIFLDMYWNLWYTPKFHRNLEKLIHDYYLLSARQVPAWR